MSIVYSPENNFHNSYLSWCPRALWRSRALWDEKIIKMKFSNLPIIRNFGIMCHSGEAFHKSKPLCCEREAIFILIRRRNRNENVFMDYLQISALIMMVIYFCCSFCNEGILKCFSCAYFTVFWHLIYIVSLVSPFMFAVRMEIIEMAEKFEATSGFGFALDLDSPKISTLKPFHSFSITRNFSAELTVFGGGSLNSMRYISVFISFFNI